MTTQGTPIIQSRDVNARTHSVKGSTEFLQSPGSKLVAFQELQALLGAHIKASESEETSAITTEEFDLLVATYMQAIQKALNADDSEALTKAVSQYFKFVKGQMPLSQEVSAHAAGVLIGMLTESEASESTLTDGLMGFVQGMDSDFFAPEEATPKKKRNYADLLGRFQMSVQMYLIMSQQMAADLQTDMNDSLGTKLIRQAEDSQKKLNEKLAEIERQQARQKSRSWFSRITGWITGIITGVFVGLMTMNVGLAIAIIALTVVPDMVRDISAGIYEAQGKEGKSLDLKKSLIDGISKGFQAIPGLGISQGTAQLLATMVYVAAEIMITRRAAGGGLSAKNGANAVRDRAAMVPLPGEGGQFVAKLNQLRVTLTPAAHTLMGIGIGLEELGQQTPEIIDKFDPELQKNNPALYQGLTTGLSAVFSFAGAAISMGAATKLRALKQASTVGDVAARPDLSAKVTALFAASGVVEAIPTIVLSSLEAASAKKSRQLMLEWVEQKMRKVYADEGLQIFNQHDDLVGKMGPSEHMLGWVPAIGRLIAMPMQAEGEAITR